MGFFDSQSFDASKVAPSTGFKPLPEGVYKVHVKSAVEEKTKDGTGLMLKAELSVLTPPEHKGKTVFHRITLKNKNPQAVEIGHAQLSAFCRGTGVNVPKSAGAFVGKICSVKIVVEKRADNGELTNKVKEVLIPEAAPVAGGPTGAAVAASEEAAPWA